MRCDFCHNSEFVLPEKIQRLKRDIHAEKSFFEFLTRRVWLLDGVSICGGEPTIHRDLPHFAQQIRDLGFAIKLDTNGQNPDMLEHLIQHELVDYIAMDIHTPEDIAGIGEIVRGAKHYYLQRYRQRNVLNPDFIGYSPTDAMLYDWRDALEWTYLDSVQIRF